MEWKESWRDEFLSVICGFANAEGGKLQIGRNDNGEVVGVSGVQKLLEDLPNKIRDVLGIQVAVNLRRKRVRECIEIEVPAYTSPISLRGHYFQRSGSTTLELKGASLDRFLLRRQGRTWDAVPIPGVNVRNLSSLALKRFRALARNGGRVESGMLRESAASLLGKLKLFEGRMLKRAAVLLFHEDPEKYVTGAFVKIGFFRSETDLAYHDEVHGDLFTQVKTVTDLLVTKYLKASIRYEGLQRIEQFPVPEPALREAILNALIHRDYAKGAPVQIRVYEDRLKIWNPAVLPEGWTLEDLLRDHASLPYNPNVANAFFRAGEIEAWGRGIQRIFQACAEARTPEPQLRVSGHDLWIEFAFPPEYASTLLSERTTSSYGQTPEWGEKWGEKTTVKRIRIALAMRKNSKVTTLELSTLLGMVPTAMDRHLKAMRDNGSIIRVGPAKGGHWKVAG